MKNHLSKTHEQFVQELKLIQPELEVVSQYKNLRYKINVIDKLGIEYSVRPDGLLLGKPPSIITALNKTTAFYIKIKHLHPTLKILSEYINRETRLLVEDDLGYQYLVAPGNLLQGDIPYIITCTDKTKMFIQKAREVHGDKYDYSKSVYISSRNKITITCPEHGDFKQTVTSHIDGKNNCRYCAARDHEGVMASVCKHNPEKETFIYLFHCLNKEEEFYKLGLSINPKNRANKIPYKTKILYCAFGKIKDLYPIEQDYHNKFKEMGINYKPLKNFNGWTECFKIKNKND